MFKIAIDGYMGSGKTSLAIGLCERLGADFRRLDTGAIFRTIAYAYYCEYGENLTEQNVKKLIDKISVDVKFVKEKQNMFLGKKNVTSLLRTPEISRLASSIAVYQCVRDKYLVIAKDFASKNNCVMEGRDIGTVVMPDANVKIFLTADEKTRAKRRYDEVIASGVKTTEKEILKDLRERDKRDSTRKIAPLKPVEDSVIVDNSDMDLEETIEYCYDIIMEVLNASKKSYSIAIDGYVCSGKSTIARELARRLGFHVFDTGACYRAIACAFRYLKYNPDEISTQVIRDFAKQVFLEVKFIDGDQHVYVNGRDYTKYIRTNEISVLSAKVSPYTPIRDKVLAIQRKFASENNTVMEGRDIGSEVLPNADFKFFVTAAEDVRASRRFEQQKMIDNKITYQKVLEDLRDRDYKDVHRKHGAIKKMPDAYVIDTSRQTLDESVTQMMKIIRDSVGKDISVKK